MPSLSVGVAHALGQEEATKRLKDRFNEVRGSFAQQIDDFEEKWDDHALAFRFKTYGLQVEGTVTSGAEEVRVDAQLPMAAAFFKKTIEQRIREELGKVLS